MNSIIKPLFNDQVTFGPITYSRKTDSNVIGQIISSYSLQENGNTEVLFITDSDFNTNPRSITQVKKEVITRYKLKPTDIIVVIIEIESWYYAGLSSKNCRFLRIPII
ncbi:MAG: hypothetical protein OEY49_15825 [Candidatus Heimdallarchaeota archaeon]|nr:hypothetical protein [Candidatus Heimdallarchaeota archaeon]